MRVLRPSSASSLTVALAATVAVLSVASADAATAADLRVNGWYPCGFSNPLMADPEAPTLKLFECAEVDVPLCYEGVCESDRTISLFVKRLVANATEKAETPKSLWMLQGGPGGSGANMEPAMQAIHRHLEYKANLYTVDHRGTGRSFFLQCDAAQAFAGGSPSGVDLSVDEVPDCLRDVLFQIDNQTAAFSVTSAAKDVEFLVQNLHDEQEEVYVYGASYGTYQTERVMHLAPPNVKGYVLDGVMAEDKPYVAFTSRNTDNVTPTKRLAQYCEETTGCGEMFGEYKKGELYTKWQEIYKELDAFEEGQNLCVDYFRSPAIGDDAMMVSNSIKTMLGPLANDGQTRWLLPALLKLFHRCEGEKDMTTIMSILQPGAMAPSEDGSTSQEDTTETPPPTPLPPQAFDVIGQMSPILGFLIKASEIWASPSPSWSDEMKVFQDVVFPQALVTDYSLVCLFNGDIHDPSCEALGDQGKLDNTSYSEVEPVAFTYKTDQYFTKFATIPDHASVLVINGKLDFQTMSDNGVREYENLKGGRGKMLVEMDYGGHCTGIGPTTSDDVSECGFRLIASFVAQSGDVDKVDTSCLEELPVLLMASADEIVAGLTGEAPASSTTAPETQTETEIAKPAKAKTTKKSKETKKFRHHN